ncbi:phospholipase D-like domain-containing protein [Terrimonas pollutisoli]|uniref:phospholipase D-like domain-containing protein n=1 Tax=Terrimonas pollutisoli TaxID=3034147 RepID=UPI0023EA952C|nr:phospholipase D-like domain-containing protein [Terrimonas sp. H1YJ31]
MRLISGGKEYFDLLLQLIDQAVESIHLQTYIFNDDETGVLVANALKKASHRNVQVYLLTDGYASQALHRRFIGELKEAGIHFRFFEPIFRSRRFYFGRRMHHKLVVVDAKYAMVGGINIADRYNDFPDKKAWLDFALYAEGDIARELCLLCWKTWYGYPSIMAKTPCERPANLPAANGDVEIVMRRNDWVRGKNQVSKTYLQMLHNAESGVIILCSYFLPGKVIRRNIVQAIKRGVSVKVIAAGSSDVMLAKHAERWLYDWLLRNGVELYEYQQNVLHGKLAVCDDKWMTIGSYNINDISAYASIELNLDVHHTGFAKEVRQKLEKIISEECIPITTEYHSRTKNIFIQFVRWISYQFIRVVFRLFTFYFKRLS